MSDLITFLNARLDEDEATATAGAKYEGKDWHAGSRRPGEDDVAIFDDDGASIVAHYVLPETAAFIAAHDPRRALREVEVKRKIITQTFAYEATLDGEWGCCHEDGEIVAGVCPEIKPDKIAMLRLLAAVYSDHPDYLPEWKP
jgi:hypothetical protein